MALIGQILLFPGDIPVRVGATGWRKMITEPKHSQPGDCLRRVVDCDTRTFQGHAILLHSHGAQTHPNAFGRAQPCSTSRPPQDAQFSQTLRRCACGSSLHRHGRNQSAGRPGLCFPLICGSHWVCRLFLRIGECSAEAIHRNARMSTAWKAVRSEMLHTASCTEPPIRDYHQGVLC
jgi:hypothetical protein